MISNVYICCLFIGIIYSLVTTFISGIVSAIDVDFDVDFDADLNVDFDTAPQFNLLLPVRPFTAMIFLTVFGGTGLILILVLPDLYTIPLALLAGYLAAKILYHTVYMALCRAQSTASRKEDSIGIEAVVLEAIPSGGIGRISYVVNKNILSAAAKEFSPGSGGFKKGQSVIIVEIVDNIYYVIVNSLETDKNANK